MPAGDGSEATVAGLAQAAMAARKMNPSGNESFMDTPLDTAPRADTGLPETASQYLSVCLSGSKATEGVDGGRGFVEEAGEWRVSEGLLRGWAAAALLVALAAVACDRSPAPFHETLRQKAGTGDAEALSWLVSAAEQDHAGAQTSLGLLYLGGEGVERDAPAAARWLCAAAGRGSGEALAAITAAAEAGDPGLQNTLGLMHLHGYGVPRNTAVAVRWVDAAATVGHPDGQYHLALLYGEGRGVARNDSAVVVWLEAAARAGHAGARNALGLRRLNGNGVAQDSDAAIRWFRAAAEQGHAGAQNHLGQAYALGLGVIPDDFEAMHWFRSAAEQGDPVAQYNLSFLYTRYGNTAEAVRWMRAAAENGYADAQFSLATEYMSRDMHAYAWLHLAAEQGHEEADRRRQALWEYMTHDDVSLAEELSAGLTSGTRDPDPERETCGR